MNINDKLQSKVDDYFRGILLKKGNKSEFVKIDGDAVEATPTDSFIEGALKGVGVLLIGGAYPTVAGILKGLDSYNKVKDVAKLDLDETNEWAVTKAALKGSFLGGVKGTLHGFLDALVIGSLTAGSVAIMGPLGFLLAPAIGGVYNVVKDAIRA